MFFMTIGRWRQWWGYGLNADADGANADDSGVGGDDGDSGDDDIVKEQLMTPLEAAAQASAQTLSTSASSVCVAVDVGLALLHAALLDPKHLRKTRLQSYSKGQLYSWHCKTNESSLRENNGNWRLHGAPAEAELSVWQIDYHAKPSRLRVKGLQREGLVRACRYFQVCDKF